MNADSVDRLCVAVLTWGIHIVNTMWHRVDTESDRAVSARPVNIRAFLVTMSFGPLRTRREPHGGSRPATSSFGGSRGPAGIGGGRKGGGKCAPGRRAGSALIYALRVLPEIGRLRAETAWLRLSNPLVLPGLPARVRFGYQSGAPR